MLVDDYAKAVAALIHEGNDVKRLLASLDAVLVHRGHQKLKSRILLALSRLMERAREGHAVLTVAHAADAAALKSEIADATKKLDASDTETVVDPTIVGGFVLRTKTKQLDRSYKSVLLNLYRSIITNN